MFDVCVSKDRYACYFDYDRLTITLWATKEMLND